MHLLTPSLEVRYGKVSRESRRKLLLYSGFEVIPEEVELTLGASGVQLGGSQRLAEAAFTSWRSATVAASTSLTTSGLSLSTRSSDVDLKEFLVHRGI